MTQFDMQAGRQKQKSQRLLRVAALVRDNKGIVDHYAIRAYVESRMSIQDFHKGCELGSALYQRDLKDAKEKR